MNILFTNNTFEKYNISVFGSTYALLKRGSSVGITVPDNETSFYLSCVNKNFSHLNFLDMLLGVFFGDSTYSLVTCDYCFVVRKGEKDNIEISIESNNWQPREQLSIYAPFAKSSDAEIIDVSYSMSNLDKVKKKHKMLHLLVTSLFPIGLISLISCFFFSPPVLSILVFLVWLALYEIPSLKEIKRFKKATEREYVNQTLISYAIARRTNGADFNEDTSKTGKLVKGIINKMFKFDEE